MSRSDVTSGIISALDRSITAANDVTDTTEHLSDLFLTDAAIISGDSGGPLVSPTGAIIGMNTAGSGGSEGSDVGFSIPIDTALAIAHQIQSGTSTATVHVVAT